jgi:hypothetical protein
MNQDIKRSPSLECQTDLVHLQDQPLTVGTSFFLICKSPSSFGAQFDVKKLHLKLKPEDQYKVQILDAALLNETQVQLTVASYKVGPHQLKDLILKSESGEQFLIPEIQFEVTSVLNPQEPEKEPFGAMEPYTLAVPLSYWIVLGTIFFLLLLKLYWSWRSFIHEKKEVQRLKSDYGGKDALSGVQMRLRTLRRQAAKAKEAQGEVGQIQNSLDLVWKEVLIYFGLRFERSTLEKTDRALFKIVSKYLKSDRQQVLLQEMKKIRQEMLSFKTRRDLQLEDAAFDFDQLVSKTMSILEQIEKSLKTESSEGL